jgi:hypothetical protein
MPVRTKISTIKSKVLMFNYILKKMYSPDFLSGRTKYLENFLANAWDKDWGLKGLI